MPIVLATRSSLLLTVLALSSAEWAGNHADDAHGQLALRYKTTALQELGAQLTREDHAEESLLTCVLQASLEIASGSCSTWLRHLRGAAAIISALRRYIRDDVVQFAAQYFSFRSTLLSTTGLGGSNEWPCEWTFGHATGAGAGTSSPIAPCPAMPWPAPGNATDTDEELMVDDHIGCPPRLVATIGELSVFTALNSALSLQAAEDVQDVMETSINIDARLHNMCFSGPEVGRDYLLKSAECFRTAARVYLRLACLHLPLVNSEIVQLQTELLRDLTCVISDRQPRRSFPMWPLFIASCVCSSDEQRDTIMHLFTVLDGQWPISNISTVWRAVSTIWKTRDLTLTSPPAAAYQDWQRIISQFGWKLALS